MSGGSFDYVDFSLKNRLYNYCDECSDVYMDLEISEMMWDLLELTHELDLYQAGDTCEETYLAAKAAFRKKWFETTSEERLKRSIDKAVEDARQSLYKTYGITETDTTSQ